MRSSFIKLITVYILFTQQQLMAAYACINLFSADTIEQSTYPVLDAMITAKAQQASVSAKDLSAFFMEVSQTSTSNAEKMQQMALMMYTELGREKVQELVEGILTSYPHEAQRSIFIALYGFARGDINSARGVSFELPKPISREQFLNWSKTGEKMPHNKNFLAKLADAIADQADLEPSYREKLDVKKSSIQIIQDLINLNSDVLVGQFVELFVKSDRLTRAYMLGRVGIINYGIDGRYAMKLRLSQEEAGSVKRYESISALAELINKSAQIWQEEAYFSNETNAGRPNLSQVSNAVAVALRVIERRNFTIYGYNPDAQAAVNLILSSPKSSSKIDRALRQIQLESAKFFENNMTFYDGVLMRFELEFLSRRLQGLSSGPVDLRFTRRQLTSHNPGLLGIIDFVVKFLNKNGYDASSELKQMVIAYVQNDRSTFEEYFNNDPQGLTQLLQGLGIR